MPRILAIDYGLKRTGLAVTDPLQIIATALPTVETGELLDYIKAYLLIEDVEKIIIGLPKNLRSEDTHITNNVRSFAAILEKNTPNISIVFVDERFTSKIASQALHQSGGSKKQKKDKGNIDAISAVLILQEYMGK